MRRLEKRIRKVGKLGQVDGDRQKRGDIEVITNQAKRWMKTEFSRKKADKEATKKTSSSIDPLNLNSQSLPLAPDSPSVT